MTMNKAVAAVFLTCALGCSTAGADTLVIENYLDGIGVYSGDESIITAIQTNGEFLHKISLNGDHEHVYAEVVSGKEQIISRHESLSTLLASKLIKPSSGAIVEIKYKLKKDELALLYGVNSSLAREMSECGKDSVDLLIGVTSDFLNIIVDDLPIQRIKRTELGRLSLCSMPRLRPLG